MNSIQKITPVSGTMMAAVMAVAGLLPAPVIAVDPNSLTAVRSGASVVLEWSDPSPTRFCIVRAASAPPTAIVGSSSITTFTDTPPAGGLWFYGVNEPLSGNCAAATCAAAANIGCNDTVAGSNSAVGSSDVTDAYPTCGVFDASGPEFVYSFVPATSGPATITLSGLTDDLDLFILEDTGSGCDPTTCRASGDTTVTTSFVAGTTYFIVVDGRAGAVSSYNLAVSSCGTGSIDCAPVAGLVCPDSVSGRNDGGGSTNVIDDYSGCGLTGASGPEIAYTFDAQNSGLVNVALSNLSADLDVFVLANPNGRCEPAQCIGHGDIGLSFNAVSGSRYYVVIDGIAGATGNYTLDMTGCGIITQPVCSDAGSILCGGRAIGMNSDPGNTDVIDTWPTCSALDESGPEYSYSFVATGTGDVTAAITGTTGELDLFVMADVAGSCAPSNCLAFGDNSVTFPTVAGDVYHIVVDGRQGATSSYLLNASCAYPPGTCQPAATLACGDVFFGNNGAPASTDANDAYPACSGNNESGPEYTFVVRTDRDTVVKPSLDSMTGDADVFVLDSASGVCSPANCVAWGDSATSFTTTANELYYVVVDGRDGAVTDFRVLIECAPVPGNCQAADTLACGETKPGNNGAAGSTDAIDQYESPCLVLRPLDESGPEYAYSFTAPSNSNATVDLTNMSVPLHLYVMEDRGNSCAAPDCVAFGISSVSWPARAGIRYFILVEGFEGAIGNYDIGLRCN